MIFVEDRDLTIHVGDVRDVLPTLPAESVDCVATSPPFYALRDYGTGTWEGGDPGCDHVERESARNDTSEAELARRASKYGTGTGAGSKVSAVQFRDICRKCGARRVDRQIGLESTPDEWVAELVGVFRECRRILRPHGTLWVECGDSYNAGTSSRQQHSKTAGDHGHWQQGGMMGDRRIDAPGFKVKDLLGTPWLLAFVLRADGWYLRQCIVWSKPNAMPESVRDRCTTAHSYVFLLSKSPRYFFDADEIAEPYEGFDGRKKLVHGHAVNNSHGNYANMGTDQARWPNGPDGSRNARSVWTIPTRGYPGAHFATWPEALAEKIILAGCPEKVCEDCGIVLDQYSTADEHQDSAMRGVREGSAAVRSEEPSTPLLLENMREPLDGATSGYDEGVDDHVEGLQDAASQGSSLSDERRLRDGASAGDGGRSGTPADSRGSRASQERDQGRQPAREPRADGAPQAQRSTEATTEADPMPSLWWRDSHVGTCPSCGGRAVPGRVLDPFFGAGTTGLVARRLGRRCVGVELNEEYARMAAERCQQLSLFAEF